MDFDLILSGMFGYLYVMARFSVSSCVSFGVCAHGSGHCVSQYVCLGVFVALWTLVRTPSSGTCDVTSNFSMSHFLRL